MNDLSQLTEQRIKKEAENRAKELQNITEKWEQMMVQEKITFEEFDRMLVYLSKNNQLRMSEFMNDKFINEV